MALIWLGFRFVITRIKRKKIVFHFQCRPLYSKCVIRRADTTSRATVYARRNNTRTMNALNNNTYYTISQRQT